MVVTSSRRPSRRKTKAQRACTRCESGSAPLRTVRRAFHRTRTRSSGPAPRPVRFGSRFVRGAPRSVMTSTTSTVSSRHSPSVSVTLATQAPTASCAQHVLQANSKKIQAKRAACSALQAHIVPAKWIRLHCRRTSQLSAPIHARHVSLVLLATISTCQASQPARHVPLLPKASVSYARWMV